MYQEPADWVKKYLKINYGHDVQEVVLDPYAECWLFYTAEGKFVTAVSHDCMERLLGVLLWKEFPKET